MFNAMIETLKANPRKIVFTEGHDARILAATARLVEGGFLTPILIGNVEEVKANAAKGGFNIEGVERSASSRRGHQTGTEPTSTGSPNTCRSPRPTR